MTDDVKKALKWLGTLTVPGWNACDYAETLLAHINGEPARLAAAAAREREEQRETDARAIEPSYSEACTRETDERWNKDREESFRECERAAEIVRATPLTATPLADENKALREDLEHERKTNARLLAERDEALKAAEQAWHVETMSRERREAIQRAESAEAIRDAALTQRDTALARVKELEAEVEVAWSDCEPTKPGPYGTVYVHDGCGACARCVDAARAERDAALARVKELEADVEVGRETCRRHGTTRATAADGWPASKLIGFLSHSLAGKDAAIKDAAESASRLRSERDTLKAQLAEAVKVLRYLVDFIAAGGTPDDEDLAKARAFLAKVGPTEHVLCCDKESSKRVASLAGERDALKARVAELEEGNVRRQVALEAERDELRQRILDSCPSPDEGGRIHAGGRIVCGQCHDSEVSHLRAQLAEAVEVLRAVTEALEGSFPNDEAMPKFPKVLLAEAWMRRIKARIFLEKVNL